MERFLLAVFLCISSSSLAFSADDPWNYDPDSEHGPAKWGGDCASGKKQSPIDIKSADTTLDKSLGPFNLKNYDTKLNFNFSAKNNGHALVVSFLDHDREYNVSGGGLTGVYTTVQFHFHWGSKNSQGSEHTMNGNKYAAEFHFVSYNTKYSNFTEALKKSDGLAVLGVLIEVGDANNPAFSFLDIAKELTKSDSTKKIPAFRFDAMLPSDKTKYFRYDGSLTTPTCNEVVTWTVFNDAVKISKSQMALLRALKQNNSSPLVDNYRPPQALNQRVVKVSSQVPEPTGTTTPGSSPGTTKPAGASAVSMTAGLFLSMLFAAFFVR